MEARTGLMQEFEVTDLRVLRMIMAVSPCGYQWEIKIRIEFVNCLQYEKALDWQRNYTM